MIQHTAHRGAAIERHHMLAIVLHCYGKFINIFYKFYRIGRVYFKKNKNIYKNLVN